MKQTKIIFIFLLILSLNSMAQTSLSSNWSAIGPINWGNDCSAGRTSSHWVDPNSSQPVVIF